uniref:Uncharacterized protein n=1 Tax=Oryza sativa subsp. japonica TaxID=39947 RepID=Q8LHQ3_ORYSJ|nr:hypothetical protein [Oryza sativa Japonica Group]
MGAASCNLQGEKAVAQAGKRGRTAGGTGGSAWRADEGKQGSTVSAQQQIWNACLAS